MAGGEGVFPIFDRKTPVADRIRERREERTTSRKFGKEMGEALLAEDDEEKFLKLDSMAQQFTQGLADAFGVETDQIDPNSIQLILTGESLDPNELIQDSALKGKSLLELGQDSEDEASDSQSTLQDHSESDESDKEE